MTKLHIVLAGIIGIVILDTLAIVILGIDGTILLASGSAIGGLVGYAFKIPTTKSAPKKKSAT